ncbi:response regulator transcription factor [Streptomyces pathocidini]|uniref:Response regulator transcription factor n=1 Tax=Streptomyces pathocidini TaxID=1650571 RepID=A0ABW7UKP2_9ACTN|nr:response regulator transcription factor [Streptomyces pathocidini]
MRVLIAEDHAVVARFVATGLRREAMAVDVVDNGDDVEHMCLLHAYDVLVLDRDLPGTHGDTVCRSLATSADRPRILMLTAATAVEDRVAGLGLGADDYLTKPFAFAELVARIRALARTAPSPRKGCLRWVETEMDLDRRTVARNGRVIALTAKEFDVLHLLMSRRGAPVRHDELLVRVWGEFPGVRTSAVHSTVSRLRRKLGQPRAISADDGTGYRLCGP